MLIASADIETTGLDSENHMILEVGLVLWDAASVSSFHCYVTRERSIVGDPFALSMHPTILRRIANREPGFRYVDEFEVASALQQFVVASAPKSIDSLNRAKLCFAGKNFGAFDLQFLRRLPHWNAFIRPMHRGIDVGTLYFDPRTDEVIPSIDECVRRANLRRLVPLMGTTHTALEDARLVVELLRAVWNPPVGRNVVLSVQDVWAEGEGRAGRLVFAEPVSNVASVLEINFGGSSNERLPVDSADGYSLIVHWKDRPSSDFIGMPVFIM